MKRSDVPQVVSLIQRRTPQTLDAFLRDCDVAPSDRARRIGDAVRKSLTVIAPFQDDQIRAEDSLPGNLEVLPGWDSVDLLEWLFMFEEQLGQAVPDQTFGRIGGFFGSFNVGDLVKAANDTRELLPDLHTPSE